MQFLWSHFYHQQISIRVWKYHSKTCAILKKYFHSNIAKISHRYFTVSGLIFKIYTVTFLNWTLIYLTKMHTCIFIYKQLTPVRYMPYPRKKTWPSMVFWLVAVTALHNKESCKAVALSIIKILFNFNETPALNNCINYLVSCLSSLHL